MSPDNDKIGGAKIEIRDVAKRFSWMKKGRVEEVQALDGINLTIRENEFVTIIGPSGCGKTTLLRIMASLETPDRGEVLIDGSPVGKPSHERAVVFQSFGLFPWKTVLDNVKFPLIVRDMDDAKATEIARENLAKVGLDKFGNSHPHQLSGGMQQRVGLARALATDPDILLMDEPFGAIDAQTREFMQEELMQLWQDTRKTVVFITHDLDEAILLADRVVLLSRRPGRVRDIFPIDLPRPRADYDARGHETFTRVRKEIWQALRADAMEDATAGVEA